MSLSRQFDSFSVCVFAGTNAGRNPKFQQSAEKFGAMLGHLGWAMIFGGGGSGIMGATATAALRNGASVTGVIPRSMRMRDDTMEGGVRVVVRGNMHQRKAWMYSQSDAFVVFPGGVGTLDEFVEVLSWKNLELHQKPIILMNIDGYWDFILDGFIHMGQSDFLFSDILQQIQVVNTPEQACLALKNFSTAHRARQLEWKDPVSSDLTSLDLAEKIQTNAAVIGFDWPTLRDAVDKVKEELRELEYEVSQEDQSIEKLQEEFGDVLFSLINLGRKLSVDHHDVLESAIQKFYHRFSTVYSLVQRAPDNTDLDTLLRYWQMAKKEELAE